MMIHVDAVNAGERSLCVQPAWTTRHGHCHAKVQLQRRDILLLPVTVNTVHLSTCIRSGAQSAPYSVHELHSN